VAGGFGDLIDQARVGKELCGRRSGSSFRLDALNAGGLQASLWNLKVCNAAPQITLSLKH